MQCLILYLNLILTYFRVFGKNESSNATVKPLFSSYDLTSTSSNIVITNSNNNYEHVYVDYRPCSISPGKRDTRCTNYKSLYQSIAISLQDFNNKNSACTHVYGNLVLYDLPAKGERCVLDKFDEIVDFKFLSSIKVIYGSLEILMNTELDILDYFENLTFILKPVKGWSNRFEIDPEDEPDYEDRQPEEQCWPLQTKKVPEKQHNYKKYPPPVLKIIQNPMLSKIYFPKLRIIHGGVLITRNINLCPPNINWLDYGVRDIDGGYINCETHAGHPETYLETEMKYWRYTICNSISNYDNDTARYNNENYFAESYSTAILKLDEGICNSNYHQLCKNCNIDTFLKTHKMQKDNNEGKCFNPDNCQLPSRFNLVCPNLVSEYATPEQKVIFNNPNLTQKCCPESCLGGCYFDNLKIQKLYQDSSTIKIDNTLTCFGCDIAKGYKRKIIDDMLYCVKSCNADNYDHIGLDAQTDATTKTNWYNFEYECVTECPKNMHVENNNCIVSKAPKNCYTDDQAIHANSIRKFNGCEVIKGTLIFDGLSFKSWKNNNQVQTRPILKSDLKNFHAVKNITGKLIIQSFSWALGSFSIGDAFPNLEVIQGQKAITDNMKGVVDNFPSFAVYICGGNIHLGMPKLREITNINSEKLLDVGPGICNMPDATLQKFMSLDHQDRNFDQALHPDYNSRLDTYAKFQCQTKLLKEQESNLLAYQEYLQQEIENMKIHLKNNQQNLSNFCQTDLAEQIQQNTAYLKELNSYDIPEFFRIQADSMKNDTCEPCHEHCDSCWAPNSVEDCIECKSAYSLSKGVDDSNFKYTDTCKPAQLSKNLYKSKIYPYRHLINTYR